MGRFAQSGLSGQSLLRQDRIATATAHHASFVAAQLHRVLSSITGLSGLTILDAILAGERDPIQLAALCHRQVKNSRETIAKALQGDYRREHLFAVRQSLEAYRYFQHLIAQLDAELKSCLQELPTSIAAQPELPKGTKLRQKERNDPAFDLRSELYRIVGVDLTNVPGASVMTAQAILSEIRPTVARFPNASAFASWLGLCPENSAKASAADNLGPGILDYPPESVVRLAQAVALRPARHRCAMAARTVPEILGSAFHTAAGTRSPAHRCRGAPIDRTNGRRQSAVVRTQNSWRTQDGRYRDFRAHRLAPPAHAPPPAEPDLEDLPAQPHRPNGIHRFLYRADHHHEGPVRVHPPGTRSSHGAAFQRDRASDCALDGATDRRGVRRLRYGPLPPPRSGQQIQC